MSRFTWKVDFASLGLLDLIQARDTHYFGVPSFPLHRRPVRKLMVELRCGYEVRCFFRSHLGEIVVASQRKSL
jgi:hypothetical protein